MAVQIEQAKNWIDVLQALATPAIALAGICIAWAQWKVNRAHLKHALFEKRYAIYRGASDYLSSIIRNGKPLEEEQFKFLKAIQGAKFIFNDDVCKILEDIWSKSVELECVNFELKDIPVGEERSKKCSQMATLKLWLYEALDPLTRACKSYLKLNHK